MAITEDKINDLRKRVLSGEPYTYEELAEAIKVMVADRVNSFEAPKAMKSKPTPVDLSDLL